MSSRREKLEQMLANDPRDSFLRYGLAMEYDKEGQVDRSLELFRELMQDVPPYVPAYFMCGQMLARRGRVEEARSVLRDGVEVARSQGNAHAAGEMAEFLASLGTG